MAEREPDLPALEDRALYLLDSLDLALLVSGLAGVTLVVRDVRPLLEAPDRLLQARYLLLLGDVELLLTLERQLARQGVGRVVAGPGLYLTALQHGDLLHSLVQ